MGTPLKALLVEDSPDDADLLVQELEDNGYEVTWSRVEDEQSYSNQLRDDLDVIFSDFSLPQFSTHRALLILKERALEIPFILVSGTIGEEQAVESVKGGATDYVLKDRITRLVPVLKRALRETVERKKRATLEQKLRLQATALETAANAISITDASGHYLWANAAFSKLTGFSAEEVVGKSPRILKSGHHGTAFYGDLWRTIRGGKIWSGEFINKRPDDSTYYVEQTIAPVFSSEGEITNFVGVMNDVTSRKQAEEELFRTHAKLRHLLAHSPAVIYNLRIEEDRVIPTVLSDNVERLLGFTAKEALCFDWWVDRLHPEDRERVVKQIPTKRTTGGHSLEYRVKHKDGTYRWIADNNRVIFDSEGRVSEAVGVWTDITGRKKLEEEITMREQQLSSFFTGAAAGLAIIDPSLRYVQVNETLARINGSSPEAHQGRAVAEVVPTLAPVLIPLLEQVLRTGEPIKGVEVTGEVPSEPGVTRFWTSSYFPVAGLRRDIEGVGAVVVEITDRKRAEAALFESEQKFRQLAENIEDVFWVSAADLSQMIYVSPAYEKVWGRSLVDLYRNPHEWSEAIVPEDRERVLQLFSRILEGTSVTGVEYRIRRPDQTLVWISDRGFPIRNARGEIYRQGGVATNITEKKRLESQFLRAQRMESIGTLAGGIAHDLNNVLAPILMSLDLLGDEQTAQERQDIIDILRSSAQRGTEMVKHLLTFARGIEGQKVHLQLKHVLRELQRILGQTLPKSIQIEMSFSDDLWLVLGDSTQLHQVLLNLCVNARDAMPHGGRLTIKAANFMVDDNFAAMRAEAVSGRYVTLSVADTGTGIPPEIRDRIFDPFFTTKGLDKGTGLGLATVQGIVRSHGGFITCYTEVDHGTDFHVYLPATAGERAHATELHPRELPVGKGERILVIDDEEAVRILTRKTLEAYGYEILLASDGAQGVAVCAREAGEIHLVITDLAMPLMDGPATIRAVRSLFPQMKILAWSGLDTGGKSTQPEPFGANAFLHKPFTAERLLLTVRDLLDRSPA